jgi:hypothetical protein
MMAEMKMMMNVLMMVLVVRHRRVLHGRVVPSCPSSLALALSRGFLLVLSLLFLLRFVLLFLLFLLLLPVLLPLQLVLLLGLLLGGVLRGVVANTSLVTGTHGRVDVCSCGLLRWALLTVRVCGNREYSIKLTSSAPI